jgi:hypothetical protein
LHVIIYLLSNVLNFRFMSVEKESGGERHMNMGVGEALESGRLGFDDISVAGTEELFTKAPEGQAFVVPADMNVTAYEDRAKALGRDDITFTVETP